MSGPSAILPCNHPDRIDWAIFSRLLGRTLKVPQEERAARDYLRDLLVEAFSNHQERLFGMLVWDKETEIYKSVGGLANFLRARAGNRLPGKAPGGRLRDDPFWNEAKNVLMSELWAMEDADPGIARAEKYRSLGVTTNLPVLAWLPEKCGAIPYLRGRAKHVLISYFQRNQEMPETISLDRLNAGRKPSDITADGDLVYSESGRANGLEYLTGSSVTEEIARKQAKIQAEEHEVRQKGDWPLRRYVPGFGSPLRCNTDKRKLAGSQLVDILSQLDDDIQSDAKTLRQLIGEWKGKPSFVEAFPEITEACVKYHSIILGNEKRRKRLEYEKAVRGPEYFQEFAGALLDSPPEFQLRGASLSAVLDGADFEDLDSGARPDYTFLAKCSGESPELELRGDALHAELKRLATKLSKSIDRTGKNGSYFADFLTAGAWDSRKETLGARLLFASACVAERIGIKSVTVTETSRASRSTATPAAATGMQQACFDF